MPRPHRIVVPGLPHHVTHRANRRVAIFKASDDCRIYLRLLRKHARKNGVVISGYCIMPNHIHLVAIPEREESLSELVQEAHGTYATLFNVRYSVTGHTWEGRFFSCVLDPAHFWNALRYVELNPVRANLIHRAEAYRWSSAAGHCGFNNDVIVDGQMPQNVVQDWGAWLRENNSNAVDDYIRAQTLSGHPCGAKEYFGALEEQLDRKILPRPRGRPRKMVK